MSQNNKLIFVAHNKGKVESANKYFEGHLEFQTYDYDFREIRSESIEEIAIAKVLEAYEMTKQPTIALDAGFYLEKLNGFPGVYVKHFLDTIGIAGLLKLLLGEDERECCFKQCLAYYDGNGQPKLFYGEHTGVVSKEAKGKLSKHDWSELSYIFIPEGKEVVLAEMTDDERIALAKENEENSAFKHFKEWYIDYLASEEHYKKVILNSNWNKTCKYIKDNHLISDVSFQTWIMPMKLIDCSEDCIVFEYIDDTLSEILRDTVRCIRNRYGQIILEAYNHCAGGNFKYIEIRYE